jgi:hypothetical protein
VIFSLFFFLYFLVGRTLYFVCNRQFTNIYLAIGSWMPQYVACNRESDIGRVKKKISVSVLNFHYETFKRVEQ